jgi:hypothetical protein
VSAADEAVDIVVIGRLADADVACDWPGHTILPRQGWSLAGNHRFIRELVARRRRVYVGSPITRATLVDGNGGLTLFGFELAALHRAGFVRRGQLLWPPPAAADDPFAAALAADPVGCYRRLRARAAAGDSRLPELVPTLAEAAAAVQSMHAALAARLRAIAADGAPYAAALAALRDFAAAVDDEARAADPSLPAIYGPKVAAELAPLLRLYPDVIVFPTFAPLSPGFFVRTRVVPVHPLGLRLEPIFSDGALLSPLEYFLHDVDHARFMVREELRSRGVALPDAYQSPPDGGAATTLIDAARNLHRTILDGAGAAVAAATLDDPTLLSRRDAFAMGLDRASAALSPPAAAAVQLLLFEMLHEKGLAFDARILREETSHPRHVDKLRHKLDSGFYGDGLTLAGESDALPAARDWLGRVLA